jgi:hypothetical protein
MDGGSSPWRQTAPEVSRRSQCNATRWRAASLVVVTTTMFFACRVSPLTNQIEVGEEPFVILVGEGEGGQTDLFAGSAAGGEMTRITFSRPHEWAPALDPTGGVVAFFRAPAGGDPRVVFMNLSSASERELLIPPELGPPDRIGWSEDGSRLFLRFPNGLATVQAPPAKGKVLVLTESEAGSAERALAVEIGWPVFGRVEMCREQPSSEENQPLLCVVSPGHEPTTLTAGAHSPLRWGGDSVAYMVGTSLEIRPLGGGRARRPTWTRMPQNPREPTYTPGAGEE